MGEFVLECLKPILKFADKQPFSAGFIGGAIFGAVLSFIIAKHAFRDRTSLVREWRAMHAVDKKEIKELKKEGRAKDSRLTKCHAEIRTLKKTG